MKKLMHILVTLLVITSLISCKKDKSEATVTLDKNTISAKWVVSESSEYKSFEFNESGHYIVVKNTSLKSTTGETVLFGTYQITDNSTVVLSDFGTLKVSEIDENSIHFSVQLTNEPNTEISLSAGRQQEIESSTNTELLCKTWEIVSLGGENYFNDFIVLFSKAGTYFLGNTIEGEHFNYTGTWNWCNAEETKLAFTIDYVLDCDGIEIVREIQLTSDSFEGIDMENGPPMTLIMKPVTSGKSVPLSIQKTEKKIFGIIN